MEKLALERCGGKQSAVNIIIHKVEEQIKKEELRADTKIRELMFFKNDQAQVQSYKSCFFSIIRTLTLPPS